MLTNRLRLVVMTLTVALIGAIPSMAEAELDKGKAEIAERAFIHGFRMVMNVPSQFC